jgi:hypothetical protein
MLLVLVAVYAVKLGICAYLIARLRRRSKARAAATNSAASASNSKHRGSQPGRTDLIEST